MTALFSWKNKLLNSKLTAIYLVALLLAAIGCSALGRVWWCHCGELTLWATNPWSAHNSQHFFDWYSPSHFLHGVSFYLLFYRLRNSRAVAFAIALSLEVGWEILENSPLIIQRYRAATASLGYSGDSIFNSLSDISMCALGFLLASRLSVKQNCAIFLAIELVTVYLIRDGLLLNMLMLVWPIESIRQWQLAAQSAYL